MKVIGRTLQMWEGHESSDPATGEHLLTVTIWMPMDVRVVEGYGAMSVPAPVDLQRQFGLDDLGLERS